MFFHNRKQELRDAEKKHYGQGEADKLSPRIILPPALSFILSALFRFLPSPARTHFRIPFASFPADFIPVRQESAFPLPFDAESPVKAASRSALVRTGFFRLAAEAQTGR